MSARTRRGGPRRLSVGTASLAQGLTALSSIGQSLVLVVIAGPGPDTDAFLAAYTTYLPVATLAATIRISGIHLVAQKGDATAGARPTARITGLGLAIGGLLLVVGPAVNLAMTRHLPAHSRETALAALGCLVVAGVCQMSTAGYSALISSRGRLTTSNAIYATAGFLGLAISAGAVAAVGPLGAAAGVVAAAAFNLLAHVRLAEGEGPPWSARAPFDRRQVGLARRLGIASAIPVAVQLHLVLLLTVVTPDSDNAITGITFAFFFVSVLLASSFQVVGVLGISEVLAARRDRESLIDELFVRGLPAAFRIAAPIAAGVLCLGPPVAEAIPTSVVSHQLSEVILDYLGPMVLVGIPWGIQTLLFSLALASGSAAGVFRIIPVSFLVLGICLLVLPRDGRPLYVGAALLVAETVYASLAVRAVFGPRTGRVVAGAARLSLPVLGAASLISVLGYEGGSGLQYLGAGLAAGALAAGLRQNRPFEMWMSQLREGRAVA